MKTPEKTCPCPRCTPEDKISAVRAAFFVAVGRERAAQDRKWGKGPHPIEDLPRVLGEEVGEVCRAINDGDPKNLREELIQVAAPTRRCPRRSRC